MPCPPVRSLALFALFLCFTAIVSARVHPLTPADAEIDGNTRDLRPGDVLLLQPGDYPALVFRNLHGSADAPITITNAPGGRVRIGDPTARAAVHFSQSSHLVFRGDGDPSFPYGFDIYAARDQGGVGVQVNDFSTNVELSHLEISGTGFAGIMAKTDPRCDGSVRRGEFVQRQTIIHHNYIHDVGGEGLYIGHSFYAGWPHDCDGDPATPPEIHFPHHLEGVRIHDNIIERTGWDGLQVGSAPADCEITRNTITDTGLRGVRYQQNGIQLGGGTTGLCADNHITAAGAHGIIALGIGNNTITGNIIERPGAYGLFCDDRPDTIPDSFVRIENNTVVAPAEGGFLIFNGLSDVTIRGNRLQLAPGQPVVKLGDDAAPDVSDNLTTFTP